MLARKTSAVVSSVKHANDPRLRFFLQGIKLERMTLAA
jgi:hypothetical protein